MIGQLVLQKRTKVKFTRQKQGGHYLKMAALSVAVGDSSRDVLGNVKRVAKALLQAATLDALRVEEEDKARSLDDLIR